ncbi:MAG: sugar phosphate isomerase/epimerase family protein [Planctomycetaceae bacterium]
MFVAATTRCFSDMPFDEACFQISELEFDKFEIWLNDESDHLKATEVAADPERFYARLREKTRLTPVGLYIEHDVPLPVLAALSKLAKTMRVTQITLPASPLGTPFNTEIDRLRSFVTTTSQDGIRLSIRTETGRLTEDPHTAVELCQSVRGLGLTLDPSYYICGPNRGKSYDQVFPFTYHTHLRDTTPDQLQVPVGLGEIDYSRLIGMLARQNYQRALSVDILPANMDLAARQLEMRKLRMLLDTLL